MPRSELSSAVRRIFRVRPALRAISSPISCPSPTLGFSASFCHASYRTLAVSTSLAPTRNTPSRIPKSCLNRAPLSSAFSSTATTFAAQVTQNPRTGEDGNTLMVEISERAANVRTSSPMRCSFSVVALVGAYCGNGVARAWLGCPGRHDLVNRSAWKNLESHCVT
ncbi:hypothetical protein BDV10DRAFT_77884 [Aspergillus recurvatus]